MEQDVTKCDSDHGADPTPAALAALEQVLREIDWSLIFDCLQHETFTPHAREVIANAPALLAAARHGAGDTELLEVLAAGIACKRTVRMGFFGRKKPVVELIIGLDAFEGTTLRDAIRAARAAHPEKNEPMTGDHEKKEPQRAFTPEELVRGPDDFPYTPAAELAQFHEQRDTQAQTVAGYLFPTEDAIAVMKEADRRAHYHAALAAGWSDHEARATLWPEEG